MNISAGDVGFNLESICCSSLIDGNGHRLMIFSSIFVPTCGKIPNDHK